MGEDHRIKIYNNMFEDLADNNRLELSDTTSFMCSKKYEDRFIAEYVQLMIRYGNLLDTVMSYHDEQSGFISDIEDLEEQAVIMKNYIKILEKRAKKEGIDLPRI